MLLATVGCRGLAAVGACRLLIVGWLYVCVRSFVSLFGWLVGWLVGCAFVRLCARLLVCVCVCGCVCLRAPSCVCVRVNARCARMPLLGRAFVWLRVALFACLVGCVIA